MCQLRDLLAAAPATDLEREQRVFDEFDQSSARPKRLPVQEVLTETRLPQCNIEVTVQGREDLPALYATAHHDHDTIGAGVVDNWSGVVALIQLYRRFIDRPLNRPLVLVSFALEEMGQYGSQLGSCHYVRGLSTKSVHGNVNLECLGPGPLHYWTYCEAWAPQHIPRAPYHGLPSDAKSFHLSGGYPAIVLDGIASIDKRIIHTEADTIDAIDMDHYKRSLDQIESYIRELDRLPSPEPKGAPQGADAINRRLTESQVSSWPTNTSCSGAVSV